MKGVLSARLKGSDDAETPLSEFSDVRALSDGVSEQWLADAFFTELLVSVISAPEASPRAAAPVEAEPLTFPSVTVS